VDSGDLLSPQSDSQGRLKGEIVARAYDMMGYDAITLGETDLLYGMSFLKSLISKFDLPVVSINVASRARVGEAGRGAERDSSKTPLAPDSTGNAQAPSDTTGTSPAAAGSSATLVPRTEDETAPLGDSANTEGEFLDFPPYVVKDVGGVKVGVVGVLNHRVALPASVRDSVKIGHMEKSLGQILPLIRKEADIVVVLAHCGSAERARVLAAAFDDVNIEVAGHVGGGPHEAERLNQAIVVYVRGQGRYIGRLDLLLDENKNIVGFDQETVPVAPSIPDDPEVLGLLSEYIDKLKILVSSPAFRPTSEDLKEPPASYITSGACVDCHRDQYEQWKDTPHAHAFDTLVRRQRDFDPDCQRCHTTGFRYRSGFVTPRGTPQFKDVGCEACHGPGEKHRNDPTAAYGQITEEVCLPCHTANNSPDFQYERYLKKAAH
jgi:hypothetical protein